MEALAELFQGARSADPGDRINFRDRIAAHGSAAIPTLREWLEDKTLSGFAVRTLVKIASDPSCRTTVIEALRGVDLEAAHRWTAGDVTDALARLGAARAASDGRRRPTIEPEAWPGSRRPSDLEIRFHEDMLDIFRLAGEATRRHRPDGSVVRGYWASYFLRGVRNHGGPEYAHQLLRKTGTTPGFERLRDEQRLDLTVEALVLRPHYVSLFTEEERRTAAHRLAEAGYQARRL